MSNWLIMNTAGAGRVGPWKRKHNGWIITYIITSGPLGNEGGRVHLRSCWQGFCLLSSQDRTMHRVVPSEPCPELNCPESEQIALSGRCCKVCRGIEEAWSYASENMQEFRPVNARNLHTFGACLYANCWHLISGHSACHLHFFFKWILPTRWLGSFSVLFCKKDLLYFKINCSS